RALEIGFGLVQFLLGRAFVGDAADFLLNGVDSLAGAGGAGGGVADGQGGVIHPEQRLIDRISETALFAHLLVEPRRQSAATEDVVDDIGGHEDRIVAENYWACER